MLMLCAPARGGWPTRRRRAPRFAALVIFLAARAGAQTTPARPAPQPYPPYPPAPMQAGGLAPPPPMQSGGLTPPPSGARPTVPWSPAGPTAATLAEADASDSGRGLDFFYVEGELGAQHLAPEAMHGPLLKAGSTKSGIGPSFGAGLGVRLLYFAVGPHVRYATFSSFRLLTVDLDLGWRVPLGRLEPYGVVGAGYGNLGSDADPGGTLSGFNIRLGGGLDYYVSNVLSLGGNLSAEIVRLARANFPVNGTTNDDPALVSGAYGLGIGLTLSGVAGLHF